MLSGKYTLGLLENILICVCIQHKEFGCGVMYLAGEIKAEKYEIRSTKWERCANQVPTIFYTCVYFCKSAFLIEAYGKFGVFAVFIYLFIYFILGGRGVINSTACLNKFETVFYVQ